MEREAGGAGGAGSITAAAAVSDALAEAAAASLPYPPLAAVSRAAVPGFEDPAVATRLDAILGLIRTFYVLPWYTKISPSRAFPDAVEGIIRHALGTAIQQAEAVDWPSLVTARIVPRVTEHLQHFRSVEHLAAAPSSPEKGLPLPLPTHAHSALTPRNVSPDADVAAIEGHLRGHIQRALSVILPETERTDVVRIMVREIVLGAIAMPIFHMLCDPDFWNRQISEHGAKLLHERPRATKTEVTATSITAHSTTKDFEAFMRSLPKLRTLGEARRLRADVDRELRAARAAEQMTVNDMDKDRRRAVRYVHRLERARWQIDRRIAQLSGKAESQNRQSDSLFARPVAVSLGTILGDPSCLAFWLEFMERRGRSHLVQFWLTVEGFKDPLESGGLGLETEDRGMTARTMKDDLAFLNTTYFNSDHRIAVPPRLVETVAELAEKKSALTDEEVEHGKRTVFAAQKEVYAEMAEEDWNVFQHTPDLTKRRITPERSASTSPSLGIILPRTATPPPRRSVYLDTLMGGDEQRERDPLFSDDKTDDEYEHLEAQRMEALQAALNEIIAEDAGSRKVSDSLEPPHSPESPGFNLVVDPLSMSTPGLIEGTPSRDTYHPLEGRKITSRSAEDLKGVANSPARPISTPPLLARQSARRGSADASLHRRSKSIFMDDSLTDDEPDPESAIDMLAPPTTEGAGLGDLQLSGQIVRLEARITELKDQDVLLDGLIRQAELTGNAKELKLLNRSQSSLRRELRTAELEVGQYRRQEEENRLVPGRTRGTIPYAVTEGQVVRYTVEITQTQDDRVVLAWHVAHRYSEFWELDRVLRDDPSLSTAMRHVTDLPGKRLVPLTNAGLIESRRAGLERYVQSLLAEKELCDTPVVRSFLSQRPQQPYSASSVLAPTRLVQTLYRTVASGFEEGSVPPMLDLMTQGLSRQLAEVADGVQGMTGELVGLMPVLRPWARSEPSTAALSATGASSPVATATTVTGESEADPTVALNDALPQALQPLGGEGAPGGFTAPICDLFIEVFDLKESNWLRRQAIIIILQQVLGGTIERKMRDIFKRYTAPRKIDQLLRIFQDTMFPGGAKRPDSAPRTDNERFDARITSSRRLGMLIPDVAANMIGRGNARRAAHLVWGALQDRRLNQHLVLCMFDEIFGAMFPT
ncbi:hypothetical protein CC85DRAFT_292390 [Cutaneotrichosporon oleaginosum]|uniref:PhoX domain-containing protein n=1 Tax=Cutaneotrichosporon oleaginosum TaxID=879819 RepID=A0A0J0XLF2_9TREE|nr:uncharacterized protein CC85DRAFT_292390 [Cutaneotrichosporon oleaginosum]KLT41918.1 hypothetical protein CC85DRAFT_292390 [Cutaneotrichosporon oleaginosum]TXT12518.1 hypothetical protein COLE_02928 [Cutaneotrichosporon oleaginosum]